MKFTKKFIFVVSTFVLAFILRLIAARNLGVSADDVNHAVFAVNIFHSEKLVFWGGSTNLWYYIQGVFYYLFGLNQLASRFAAALFGSFLVILIFLFTEKVFKSERAPIISAILVAISPLLIKNTLPEMDVAASFFTILAAYFMFSYFELYEKKYLFLSAVTLGIGIEIKLYVLFFAASFVAYFIIHELINKKTFKTILPSLLLFGLFLLICVSPTLVHNYLLYKDKGFMDLIFTNTFKLGVDKSKAYYGWGAGWMPSIDYSGFIFGNQKNFDPTILPGAFIVLGFLLNGDPLIFVLGLLGLVVAFKLNKKYFWFFLLTFIPAFIYLGANIPMAKHFIWGLVLLAPLAGKFLELLLDFISKHYGWLKLNYILIFLIIFNLIYLGMPRDVSSAPFYGKSSFSQLVDYKSQISNSTLLVTDSRIYVGNSHWALAGTNYLDAPTFFDTLNQLNSNNNTNGIEPQKIEVYFVECVTDDCGWGTISKQQDLNETMDQVTKWFADSSYYQINFTGADYHKFYLPFGGAKLTEYRIYKTDLLINPLIFQSAKQPKLWFLYPIGYDRTQGEIFDDYQTHNSIDRLLELSAWAVLYLELILSFCSVIFVLYLLVNATGVEANETGVC